MSEHASILVTGATGNTGKRVSARLVADGFSVTAASRNAHAGDGAEPARFDWYDRTTFEQVLRGVDRVYLVPPVGDPDPLGVVLPFLRQARASGMRRVVLLSSSAIEAGGPAAGAIHAVLPEMFDEWAVLRPSWFMQNFSGRHLHADSIRAEGIMRTAAGSGRVGFIDADDIAAVAARALTDPAAPNTDLVLTGPQALSYDDVATLLTAVTGRLVRHEALNYEQMCEHLANEAPPQFAAVLAGLDRAIANGAEDRVTDTVERVTGQPPRGLHAFAAHHLR